MAYTLPVSIPGSPLVKSREISPYTERLSPHIDDPACRQALLDALTVLDECEQAIDLLCKATDETQAAR